MYKCCNTYYKLNAYSISNGFLTLFILAGDINLLLDPKLLLLLWKLLQDGESYVRASSIYLLGDLSTHDVIWKNYCETISLSEVRNVGNTFTLRSRI